MSLTSALNDFHKAHRQAALKEIFSKLTGKSTDLLKYDEVLKKLHLVSQFEIGLHDIPLNAIIGSVGRYHDFTKDFLPKRESDKHRWANVKTAMESMRGVPPIEVYKMGEAYFVKDGNHRVSIARQNNSSHIQAYVTEVKTKVPIEPDTQPDDLIIKAEYVVFLEATRFNQLCPHGDLSVTIPGQYEYLAEHIGVHRYYMGIDLKREVSPEEAVIHWFTDVYTPAADVIRAQGILRDFPDRTVTDLYLWLMNYQAELENELGWKIEPQDAAQSMVSNHSRRIIKISKRILKRLVDILTPDTLESGPSTGSWRQKMHDTGKDKEHLFHNLLIPVNNKDINDPALQQALLLAKKESSRVNGLHILHKSDERHQRQAKAIEKQFKAACEKAGVEFAFAIEHGSIARNIVDRGCWTDLIVIKVNHPPLPNPFKKLRSGFHTLIRRSGRPILVVTRKATPLKSMLLAYDGSPKAKEALYLAAYLAEKWDARLTIISILGSNQVTEKTQNEAKSYLQSHNLEANFITDQG
ncbi:MAG: universal stress protein, partial [Anaerolineaceae bacterium]|nr:universal stress protein [Anaerolineaceae bacterium]